MSGFEQEQTRILTLARDVDVVIEERLHCLELIDGVEIGRRHVIGPLGASIGRTPPSDLILSDSEVSRTHCRVMLVGDQLLVTDLNSTNGTFVDGQRVTQSVPLPIGSVLRVGRQSFRHEWRSHEEMLLSEELDRDLEKAGAYVQALLPPPLRHGPVKTDWLYRPCAKLGGDAFGYDALNEGTFVGYLVDVCGHGAGAALHSVAIMNLLRQRAVTGADMTKPEEVLAALNAMFQMDRHAGMYFTIWYGVYDVASRRLDYASGGHHPAYLVPADRSEAVAMRTKGAMIGAFETPRYTSGSLTVPPGASLYVFSDGVFEIVTRDGVQWGLGDFLPLMLKPPVEGLSECERLYREVREAARPGALDDDFSLVVLTFD